MLPKLDTLQNISDAKIVAVIRGKNPEEVINISRASIQGGLKVIEVTYTTPNAGRAIDVLQSEDAIIGAGTVLDTETARDALLHGARFIVSPHFNVEISELCNRYAIPYLPGCLTISEMVSAMESGCDVLKLFPANNFQPNFIKSIQGPLPQVRLMPTGGINLENFKDWLDQGAFAVGIGSELSKAYAKGGNAAVIEKCEAYINATRV